MKASLPYKYITSVKNGKQYVVFDFKDKAGKGTESEEASKKSNNRKKKKDTSADKSQTAAV